MKPLSDSFYRLVYKIEYILYHAIINNRENLKPSKVAIEIPFLSSFFNTNPSTIFIEEKKKERIVSERWSVDGEFDYKIIDDYSHISKDKHNSYETYFSKTLLLEFEEPKELVDVFRIIYRWAKLISFVTKKDLGFKIRNLFIHKSFIKDFDDYLPIQEDLVPVRITNYIQSQYKTEEKEFLLRNKMLFSSSLCSDEELSFLVSRWFKSKELYPIYDYYIDSDNWFQGKGIISNVMFNNKFLNLIQGLESFYDLSDIEFRNSNELFTKNRQRIRNLIDDKNLEEWFLKNIKFPKKADLFHKLKFYIEYFNSILKLRTELESFLEDYPRLATNYRHKLSHGRIDKTFLGEDFNKIYYFTRILLCLSILHSLRISEEGIKKILLTNRNIIQDLDQITRP